MCPHALSNNEDRADLLFTNIDHSVMSLEYLVTSWSQQQRRVNSVPMAYDRLDNYPLEDQPGITHIGMFLIWSVAKGLFNSDEDDELVAAVDSGEATGRAVLASLDGKFWESDLSDAGNAFALSYYASGQYVGDFVGLFGGLVGVPETPENQGKLSRKLDDRYDDFLHPPFWAFWRRRAMAPRGV